MELYIDIRLDTFISLLVLASNNLDGYGDGVEVAGAGPLGGEGAGVGGVVPPPALQPLVPVLASLHAGGGGRGGKEEQR